MLCQSKRRLMDIQSETKPNSLRQFRPTMQKNKSICRLTVSDDQLPVGSKWENVEFSFPTIPIKPFPFPFPCNQLTNSQYRLISNCNVVSLLTNSLLLLDFSLWYLHLWRGVELASNTCLHLENTGMPWGVLRTRTTTLPKSCTMPDLAKTVNISSLTWCPVSCHTVCLEV